MTEVEASQAAPAAPVKKKINRADFMFKEKDGETLIKVPGQIDGRAFAIRNLENCKVYLYDHIAQITVDKCNNCTFVVGPVKGSIFLRDCTNCTVHVACQQFRCRDFINSTVYLYAANDPIIEASTDLKFGPFNIGYPKLKEHAEAAGLTLTNKWELLFDFTSNADGRKNFAQIDPAEWSTELLSIPDYEGTEQPELFFDYPLRYGGTLSDEPPESTKAQEEHAFSVQAMQAEAQAQAEASQQQQQQNVAQASEPVEEQQPAPEVVNLTSQDQAAEPIEEAQPPASNQDAMYAFAGFEEPPAQTGQLPISDMPVSGVLAGFNDQPDSDPFGQAVPQQVPQLVVHEDGNDWTEEERELIRKAEEHRQQIQQNLFQLMQEEQQRKNERRQAATQVLNEMKASRARQIEQTLQNNIQLEAGRREQEARDRSETNQWERICNTCDMTSSYAPGGRDLSRMKSAMLARKADLKSGAAGTSAATFNNF